MSRVGKNPISIPSGTQVTLNGNKIQVKGSLGVLSRDLSDQVKVSQDGEVVSCLLYTSPSPRDRQKSRMPSSA